MPKVRTTYVCRECGAESSQWFGKCPSCGTYGSLEEQLSQPTASTAPASDRRHRAKADKNRPAQARAARHLDAIASDRQARFSSGYQEFDRVLGGGLVPGSLVLIGGDPGIGKSTLLLQTARAIAAERSILYVCAEESGQQVKLRATRLGVTATDPAIATNLYLLPEIGLEVILAELEALRPAVAVIDSIQALYFSALTSAPGSVAQVRECTAALMRVAKQLGIVLLIVGHVTKEGAIAGPRVLEHLVDTVLYFEGDRYAAHRLLRSVKNRFGATHEIGIFEMGDRGLDEVLNPSRLFLGNTDDPAPGTAAVVACEGTRPLVVELQALVSPTSYASPRRSATGASYNRLQQILAVLEKRVGIPLSKLDAYVAAAGGMAVEEPATDLGIAIAIVASFRDRVVDPRTVLIGEVGLGGQVRLVSQLELRLKEAAKLGFRRAIVPQGQSLPTDLGLELIPVSKAIDAIVAALPATEKPTRTAGN
ncbi:MAG: DNA repair protein RadA [Spirulinaceae cyanobacterium SM2_1_0]|nr:DNA repair protein RadA [Spirulinaceae cyanobacterium SM2_1_0]